MTSNNRGGKRVRGPQAVPQVVMIPPPTITAAPLHPSSGINEQHASSYFQHQQIEETQRRRGGGSSFVQPQPQPIVPVSTPLSQSHEQQEHQVRTNNMIYYCQL